MSARRPSERDRSGASAEAGSRMATGSLAGKDAAKAASSAASSRGSTGRMTFGDRRGMASSISLSMTGSVGRALIRIKAVDDARRQGFSCRRRLKHADHDPSRGRRTARAGTTAGPRSRTGSAASQGCGVRRRPHRPACRGRRPPVAKAGPPLCPGQSGDRSPRIQVDTTMVLGSRSTRSAIPPGIMAPR